MRLRLILGDQLNHQHSWFSAASDDVLYVMMEMRQETDYVAHHIQKIVAFFLAMRSFAAEKEAEGHQFIYLTLNDERNQQALPENLQWIIKENEVSKFEYQLPDEYRLDQQLKKICEELTIPTEAFGTEHFLTKRSDVGEFFKGRKTFLMENFYRSMRKKYDILMEEGEPVTGKWNYDAENRKKLPNNHVPVQPIIFDHDVSELTELIKNAGIKTIGTVDSKQFIWPVNRAECLQVLEFFVTECLPFFGTFEDAMAMQYWSIYHARLSFAMNSKMLSPLEVVTTAVQHWQEHSDTISISQIEGFVRQIMGWREYMRGMYWHKMPDFQFMNHLGHTRALPSWYWTGKTNMNCLKHAIGQSLKMAYAHHIQRLMITGNFALLAGISPDEVDEWYLGIYIDAIEWVEITNTRGMSQFADGGLIGTKPYVSSANYINKMSDYCGACHYNKDERVGERACPFNSLYWHFFERHREKLQRNPRIGLAYRHLDKMDESEKRAIFKQAEDNLRRIDNL